MCVCGGDGGEEAGGRGKHASCRRHRHVTPDSQRQNRSAWLTNPLPSLNATPATTVPSQPPQVHSIHMLNVLRIPNIFIIYRYSFRTIAQAAPRTIIMASRVSNRSVVPCSRLNSFSANPCGRVGGQCRLEVHEFECMSAGF